MRLWRQTGVPIKTIHDFKRMKELNVSNDVVVAALRKSKELLEVLAFLSAQRLLTRAHATR